jgi:hypothetical protein
VSVGTDGVLTRYLLHIVERIRAPQATVYILVGELVFLICSVLQNSANLVRLSHLYRSSPKEIPIYEAIVLSSLPPLRNAGKTWCKFSNSVVVQNAQEERNVAFLVLCSHCQLRLMAQ